MLVALHTQNRFNPGTSIPGDCTLPINLSQNFGTKPTSGGYSIEAVGGNIPWTWYSIAAGRNDTFTVQGYIGPGPTTLTTVEFTLPQGSYNAPDLANIIDDIMSTTVIGGAAGGANLQVSYNQTLGKFQLELTIGGTVTAGNFVTFIPSASPAHEVLGFSTRGPPFTVTAGDPVTPFPNIADMTHIDEVYVVVDWPGVTSYLTQTTGAQHDAATTGTFRSVIAIAQVPEASWGSKCVFQNTARFISNTIPSSVSMSLVDHEGRTIDTNGVNWSINLRVYDLPGIAKSENHVTTVRADEPLLSNAPDPGPVGEPNPRKRRAENAMIDDGPPARRGGFSEPSLPLSLIGRQPRG